MDARIVIIPLLLISLALVIAVFVLLREKRAKTALLNQKQQKLSNLEARFSKLLSRYMELKEFRNSMNEAEITTRLQTPRLAASPTAANPRLNEKYRLILTLSEKEMTVADIAEVLSLSVQEISQVLALSDLGNKKSASESPGPDQ